MTDSTSATAPVVSVASSGSAGAAGGSVINVSTLVSQLVTATAAPQEALISSQTQQVTTQISALGTLKGALATFQAALASVDTPSALQLETATSSDPGSFTASASSGAPRGTYSLAITQLAQAQQLLSAPAAAGATFGSGTLTVTLGASTFTVTTGANATLQDIAAAIDSATANPGVSASVLHGTDGDHLLLASALTGAANQIQVTETDGGGALGALTTGTAGNYTQEVAAQDAAFSVSGVNFTSASNTVTDAVGGVALNLLGTTTAPATFTVGTDTATLQTNISAFVDAYNTLHTALVSLGGYDASSGTAGPMMGSAVLTGIQNQVQRALYSVVPTGSSTYQTLASIGIVTQRDGSLSVNTGKLATALSANLAAVTQLFGGAQGVASTLNSEINNVLSAQGSVTVAGQTLTSKETALNKQSDQLNEQMSALTASLTQQFTALNTLLSSLQTTSSYLTQAFASLPHVQSQLNN